MKEDIMIFWVKRLNKTLEKNKTPQNLFNQGVLIYLLVLNIQILAAKLQRGGWKFLTIFPNLQNMVNLCIMLSVSTLVEK